MLTASQYMPVLEEHSFPVPQTQVGEEPCGLEPSWGSQAGAMDGAHRQDRSLYPQSREEPVLVLKYTADPALFETQPRGSHESEPELTLVSLNPSAVLACSHVALSVIQPPPSSSVHLPDHRTRNPTPAPHGLVAAHGLAADTFVDLWFTEDHREAERAFAEKRKPVFKGK